MANKYSDQVRRMTFVLSEIDFRKLELEADYHKMNPSECLRWIISRYFQDVHLTDDEMEIVLQRIREKKQKGKKA